MAVTIYDIARHANVSIATVSRVLNGNSRVSERTRARVYEVARRLNYEPNVSAQSLAARKTHLVAAVVPMLTNYFFIEVIRGMQDALADTRFNLLVYSASTPEEADGQIQLAVQKGRSEGALLFSSRLSAARARRLNGSGHPVVLVDAMHPGFDSVAVDSHKGGVMATEHLLAQGFGRIGLVMGNPDSAPAAGRRAGYEEALRRAGVEVEEGLIEASRFEEHHGFTEAFGNKAARRLLGSDRRPDAVFATSDLQALGVMRAAEELGMRVPEELGVIGFDDILVSRYVGLTTLRQPMYDMGLLAITKLLARMEQPGLPVSHTVFSPTLVVRDTTRAAP